MEPILKYQIASPLNHCHLFQHEDRIALVGSVLCQHQGNRKMQDTMPHLTKLEDRGRRMVFIGYEQGTKGYRMYDLVEKKVHINRDVVFDEAAQWKWSKGSEEGEVGSGNFSMEYLVLSNRCTSDSVGVEEVGGSPLQLSPGGQELLSEGEELDEPHQDVSDHLDIDHDDAPLRLRSMGEIVGHAPVPGLAARVLQQEQLHAVSIEEPSSLEEAERDSIWKAAMVEEIRAIEENGT
jgi:hypothetical protein